VRDGIFEALIYRFAIDPTMAAFGERESRLGRAFAVYRGLTELLPYHRCFNFAHFRGGDCRRRGGIRARRWPPVVAEADCTPTSWAARADEIFNQLSKWQAMSAGRLTMPVVLRISVGASTARNIRGLDRAGGSHPRVESGYPVIPTMPRV